MKRIRIISKEVRRLTAAPLLKRNVHIRRPHPRWRVLCYCCLPCRICDLTSWKNIWREPAAHKWQHAMSPLCPTFWYEWFKTAVLACDSTSARSPVTAICHVLSWPATSTPAVAQCAMSSAMARRMDLRRPAVFLNFLDGNPLSKKWLR